MFSHIFYLKTYICTEEAGDSDRDVGILPAEKQTDLGWSEGEE